MMEDNSESDNVSVHSLVIPHSTAQICAHWRKQIIFWMKLMDSLLKFRVILMTQISSSCQSYSCRGWLALGCLMRKNVIALKST